MAILLIINRYKYLLLAVLLFGAGWYFNGLRWESKYADQLERARDTEQALQETVDANTEKAAAKVRSAVRERDVAIDRLRERRGRMPEASRANCAGATGKELSADDGIFLRRYATDQAEACWIELGRAYDYADAIQESYASSH
jgi:hypothetical protein